MMVNGWLLGHKSGLMFRPKEQKVGFTKSLASLNQFESFQHLPSPAVSQRTSRSSRKWTIFKWLGATTSVGTWNLTDNRIDTVMVSLPTSHDEKQAEAAQAFLETHKEYLENTLNPVLDAVVQEVLQERPEDPVPFIIRCLCDQLKKREVKDPYDLFHLERCAAELEQHVCDLKKNGGVMPQPVDEDYLEDDDDDDDDLFADDPLAELRRRMAAIAAQKGDVEQGDEGVSNSEDSMTDSDDDEDDDDVASLPDAPPSYLLNRPRHSVSAEAYGEFNKRREFTPPYHPKSFEGKQKISAVLENLFLFQALDGREIDTVISAMEEIRLTESTRIIQQGDDGDALYIIGEGILNCMKIFNFRHETPLEDLDPEKCVKVCGPGDLFGELALLYNCPRAASVESEGPALLWKLDRETFNHIVKDAACKKRELYHKFLSNVPLLNECDPYERSKIADALKTAAFEDGAYIVTQGDAGDTFYFIEEGKASAIKSFQDGSAPVEVMRYSDGDYFGELAILRNAPRAASVVTRGRVRVAYLNRHAFKRLLGPVEAILERNTANYAGRQESVVLKDDSPSPSRLSQTVSSSGAITPVESKADVTRSAGAAASPSAAASLARMESLARSASRGAAPAPLPIN